MAYRFLLGAMQQGQVTQTVRLFGMPHEAPRLPQIIETWRTASARMQTLLTNEIGAADQVLLEDPPGEIQERVAEIQADPLFQASFSDAPTSVKIVEIDSMVAPQRDVNMDYVAILRRRITADMSLRGLVEFCLATRADPPEFKTLQNAPNQITFSSLSLDLRFLGGFPKGLSEDDIRVAHMGGRPVAVIALLVGFGAPPINAWQVGSRLVLANGFHRTFALRQEGIAKVPIVVRHIANPQIEFPDQYLGLSRSYLLEYGRPVLIRDFFDDQLTLDIQLRPRRKILRVSWGPEDSIAPE